MGVQGDGHLNSTLQGMTDMLNNAHGVRFRWQMDVSEVRRVFLEQLGNNS